MISYESCCNDCFINRHGYSVTGLGGTLSRIYILDFSRRLGPQRLLSQPRRMGWQRVTHAVELVIRPNAKIPANRRSYPYKRPS